MIIRTIEQARALLNSIPLAEREKQVRKSLDREDCDEEVWKKYWGWYCKKRGITK